jgi:peptidoglycan/xylan/chitin deacetylase (PgdA/CDA1 family)
MRGTLFGFRARVFKVVTFLLFYSGTLRFLAYTCSKLRPRAQLDGKVSFPFVQKRQFNSLQILTYHRVNDDRDPFFPALNTEQLASQMAYLSEYWSPLPLEQAVEMLQKGDLPPRAVVVTFDDGYRDNYLCAYPILARYGVPATIFLASGAIGSGRMLWHDRVFRAFRETKVAMLEGIAGLEGKLPVRNVDEKHAAQARVLQLLWALTDEERLDRIRRLEEQLAVGRKDTWPGLMLTWEDVCEMAANGISFGSHTISHPILSTLPECRIRQEIVDSKVVIEKQIGSPVIGFAYPVGRKPDFNDRVKAIVKEAGYKWAVTTIFGVNEAGQDLFELRRGTPWELDIPSFAAKLAWYKFVGNSVAS